MSSAAPPEPQRSTTNARASRWPAYAGWTALAVVVVIGLSEAAGWPFLVGPLQRGLSSALHRQVSFNTGDGRSGVRIGLLGSLRISAPTIEIAAPAWSDDPYMVLAHGARLKLGYLDLWRAWRGGPVRVRRLRADDLDARIERRKDGRASWQFGPPKSDEARQRLVQLPSFGQLRVADGKLLYRDEVLEANLDADFSLTEGAPRASEAAASQPSSAATVAPAGSGAAPTAAGKVEPGLQLHATGHYRRLPLKIDFRTSTVLGAVGPRGARLTQPVYLDATIGHAVIHFDGAADDALHLSGLKGNFKVEGPSLASVGDPVGITLPATPPFKTHGTLEKQGDVYHAVFEEATIGQSRLKGDFQYDRGRKVPLLSGTLGGSRLVLTDLGPAIGAAPRPAAAKSKTKKVNRAKVLPDRRFDIRSLRAMDADVKVDIAYLDLGTSLLEPLKPLRGHLVLKDGVLRLEDLDARTADGTLTGQIDLDGSRSPARWSANLALRAVRLEHWLRQGRQDAPPYISGRMDAEIKVAGAGDSTADILGSLNGAMRFHLREGTLSHLITEAAGIDVAQALGVFFKGDDPLPIGCNVADLIVDKGVARPRLFVIDTRDSTIWIDGSVSLQQEKLDLTIVVSPKDFSPLTLRTPIHVRGTLGSPSVSLEKGPVGAKVGAAALLALINPIAAVIPFIDPGDSADAKREAAECADLARRGNLSRLPQRKGDRPVKAKR